MTKIKINSSSVVEVGNPFDLDNKKVIPYTLADGSCINSVSQFKKGDVIDIYLVKSKFGLSLNYVCS